MRKYGKWGEGTTKTQKPWKNIGHPGICVYLDAFSGPPPQGPVAPGGRGMCSRPPSQAREAGLAASACRGDQGGSGA
eukprot:7646389-Pyramimonas_sp.AAC.1